MTTENQAGTNVAEEIAAARARWAETQAREAAEQAAVSAQNAAINAAAHRQLQARLAKYLPAWMIEYIQPESDIDPDSATEDIRLHLPECSPITVVYDYTKAGVGWYQVDEPLAIVDEGADCWWVKSMHHRAYDIDQAVTMAFASGPRWHEMTAEAERRNQEGIRPEPPPPPAPDNVDKLAQLLAEYTSGMTLTQRNDIGDGVTLIASGLFAIADQLRRIADAREAY